MKFKKIILLFIALQFFYSLANAQIKLVGNITTSGVANYPTHIDSLSKGGYMSMPTIALRDAIPTLRRKYGMLVFVQDNGIIYKLNAPTLANTDWVTFSYDGITDAVNLTGTTLKSTVINSSLTSVGTIASLTTGAITNSGKVIVGASSAASASAVLEASSTTQGFLLPRMTKAERDVCCGWPYYQPTVGLMIFCTDNFGGEIEVSNGNMWVNMKGRISNSTLSIGDNYQGGRIFYFLVSGDPGYDANVQHGLIAATVDQSTGFGIRWDNGSYIDFNTFGSTVRLYSSIGTGLSNTNNIIARQGVTSTNYAAGLARAYNGGGYSDWYLPSKDELNQLYINRVAIGGFTNAFYWSSTEATQFFSWRQNLNDGTQDTLGKSGAYYVRAVRTFSIPALTVVGNTTISGSLNVTGSVNINNLIKLTPVTSFPNGQAGMLVASASYGKTNLYVYDGSNWKWLVTGSIA